MENTIHSLENLFRLSSFCIPQYQRAYAWEIEPQLTAFLSDLRQQVESQKSNPKKQYFLGTLLLHEVDNNKIHIVDGQQRLTTSVILISAALKKNSSCDVFTDRKIKPKRLKNYFVYSDIDDIQKFKTISEDNLFFKSHILGLSEAPATEASPSSRRLKQAFDFFINSIKDNEWEGLVSALTNAKVMVYSVSNAADATLIFELQNDRGKKLTDLEALKSYLMHSVYLNAKKPDDALEDVQSQFSNIYRSVEQLSMTKVAPMEDAILSYHCVAHLPWVSDEWRRPKDLIKQVIKEKNSQEIVPWILFFVSSLFETYKSILHLLSSLDDYPELAELLILDRMATFWPTVLKAYFYDKAEKKNDFRLACRLMEVYALRGYGISGLRSDAGLSALYRTTRDFTGNFNKLHAFIHASSSWYEIPSRWDSGLDRSTLYKSNRRDVQYILWRYENHLRTQPGKTVGKLSWRDYLFPSNDASKLSIEHVAAQSNPISETIVEWDSGVLKQFQEVATHRLGNLVLDSKSANSSKGKYDFSDKLHSLSTNSTFLSQGELINWANLDHNGDYTWSIDSVRQRHFSLKEFANNTWNPDTYFRPTETTPDEESINGD